MKLQTEKNGKWQDATKQEFLEAIRLGFIRPETTIRFDEKPVKAKQIEGVVFPETVSLPAKAASQGLKTQADKLLPEPLKSKRKSSWRIKFAVAVVVLLLFIVMEVGGRRAYSLPDRRSAPIRQRRRARSNRACPVVTS